MNLEDVIDSDYGLQQDDWSLHGGADGGPPRFGDDQQLTVIGWNGRNKSGNKLYILKCHICAKDIELHGEGVFRSLKGNLVKCMVPCGCGKNVRWSQEQYKTLCSRKATSLGFIFTGFIGKWKGRYSNVSMVCIVHGEWNTGNINNLINKGYGCPGCQIDCTRVAMTKPDETMIASFLKSGAFPLDTKFWRSERLDSRGYPTFWHVSCPECGEAGEGFSSNLQLGKRPCACSTHRQKECYINYLVDGHDNAIAIKFGIANNSKHRIKRQNKNSVYEVMQYQVYTFPDVSSCKAAERECKKELETGVVLKRDMSDGYSETTWTYNLQRVIIIYKRNGGTLV